MDNEIIASYYVDTGTDYPPYYYDVQNVERAAERCGTNLVDLAEVFHKLPDDATIVLDWAPEEGGGVDTLTYVFKLAKV